MHYFPTRYLAVYIIFCTFALSNTKGDSPPKIKAPLQVMFRWNTKFEQVFITRPFSDL